MVSRRLVRASIAAALLVAPAVIAPLGAKLAWAQATPSPTTRNAEVQRLLDDAWKIEQGPKPDEAEEAYKAAIAVAEKLEAPAEIGRGWLGLGRFYNRRGRSAQAVAAGERALRFFEDGLPPGDAWIVIAHGAIGIFANAAQEHAKAEKHLRWIVDAFARDPRHISATEAGTASVNLSVALRGLGRTAEAEAALRRAIEIREGSQPRDDALVAIAWRWLADFLADERRLADAEAAWTTAVAVAEHLPPAQDTLPSTLIGQAMFLLKTSKFEDARAAALRALQLREAASGPDHFSVAEAHLALGRVATAAADGTTATTEYDFVLEHYKRKPSRQVAPMAAAAAYQLALSYRVAKQPADAERMVRTAIALRAAVQPADATNLSAYWRVLALALWDQDQLADAEHAFRRTLELYGRAGKGGSADDGTVHLWLGDVLFSAGLYPQAEEVQDRARTIFAQLGEPMATAGAELRLGITLRYLWRGREAEGLARKALAAREDRLKPDDPLIGEAARELAAALRWQGRNAEAEPLYRRALAIREAAHGPDSQLVLADRYGLALAIEGQGRIVEAEGLLRRSLDDRERALGEDHTDVAETLVSLVRNLRRQGRFAEAAPLAERPLAIFRKRLGPDHPAVVNGLVTLALIHQDRSQYEDAERLFRKALQIRSQTYGEQSPNVAESYGDLLRLAMARRQFEEAAALAGRRLAIFEAKGGPDSPALIGPLLDLQMLKGFTGDLDAVDRLAKRTLQIAERTYGEDSVAVAVASMNVADAYRLRGKLGNLALFYDRPLAILEKRLGPDHPLVAEAMSLVAAARIHLGKPQEAMVLYDQALAILVERFSEDSPALAGVLTNKALLLVQLAQLDEAERLLRRAAELLRQGAGKPTAALAIVLVDLSFVLEATSRQKEAQAMRQEAVDIFSAIYGPNRLPPMAIAPLLPPSAREI